MKTGEICYKDTKGKCYQDGFNGVGAFMICEKGYQIIMNIVDHPPLKYHPFYKYNQRIVLYYFQYSAMD